MIQCLPGNSEECEECELEHLALSFVSGTLAPMARLRVDEILRTDGRFARIVAEVELLRRAVRRVAGLRRRAIPFAHLRRRIRAEYGTRGYVQSPAASPAGGGFRRGVASGAIRE